MDSALKFTLAGVVVAGVALVVPAAPAFAAVQNVSTYDAYANGGNGEDLAPYVTSFSLDGVTYATDGAVDSGVYTSLEGVPLSSGASDGVLMINYPGDTPMTQLTVSLSNGDPMTVTSFDFDGGFSSGQIYLAPDGNVAQEIQLTGSQLSGHVDLSGSASFKNVTSMVIIDSGDSSTFTPTLNNFAYTDLDSPPALTASGGSSSFVAGDNTASTPVAVDSGITFADGDSSTAASATVAITGNLHAAEDVLSFTNTSAATYGNIGAAYNASTGVLTLTSAGTTATLAQWQSALRAATYTDTAVTPNSATRTVSFTANDGVATSNTVSKNVTVTDTDQTPIVTTTGGSTDYVGGSSAVTIDGGISLSDLDNMTQSMATVAVTTGFHSGDTLGFTNTSGAIFGNVYASYNAMTGVLTLTSAGNTATNAQWTNALRAVTFDSSSTTYGNRTISFAISDGTKSSATSTDTVDVLTPAQITTDSGSASFVAGDNTASTPVVIDSGLAMTDSAASTLASATVTITGNFHAGEDVLGFTNDGSTMGNLTGSYNAGTGVLALISAGATATLAQSQNALRAVTYTDTAVTPNSATRTTSFTFVDGGGTTSNTATRTVTVTDTDQTPIVTTTGGTTDYVAGTSAVMVDNGISVSDLDNATQSSATVAISTGFHSGDTLGFTNDGSTMGNITASYNAATGVLTLTSAGNTATNAQWANALRVVTFSTTSATTGNRTISFATIDGTKSSAASTDTVDVLGPPTVTTDSGSAAFVSGDNTTSTPVVIDSGITVTDGSASGMNSATVAITGNFQAGEDVLGFTNDGATMGNIAGSYDAATGVLTLTSAGGTATVAQFQAALQSITYTDSAVTPNSATRTISFTVVDGIALTSNTATRTVTVTDTDQTPIVTTTGGTTDYVGGASAATVDAGITVSDLDNTTLASATVAISTGFHSGDTLVFTNDSSTMGNITASYNAATGVLTLTSAGNTATNAQWTHAVAAVGFSSSSATSGNRTISFTTNDGVKTSSAATKTVDLLGPPTITTDSGSAAFMAGDNATSTAVVVDSGVDVADGAATTLASATVAITGNFHAGEDVLGFTNDGATMGNIAASFNAATGVLTLTSAGTTATIAQWAAALQSVMYTDTAVTPNNATRTISFSAIDGSAIPSNTATRTVTVTDTDQTPIVATSSVTVNYALGSSAKTVDAGIAVSDLDNTTQESASASITTGFDAGDTLAFTNDGSTMGNITASYNTATGVLTLTSAGATATNAQWANALSAITFSTTSATTGNRTISFTSSDGAKTSSAVNDTVTVFPEVVTAPPLAPPTYPGITRISGPDRIGTSVAASRHEFPGAPSLFTANAVVLVNADDAIDGLIGAPLSAAVRGPLLYVNADSVPLNVLAEIHRLLGSSGKVYLLGGTAVIGNSVETQLQSAGLTTERIAGADRYATAVAIANEIVNVRGTLGAVFEATGLNAADALAAGPAAAHAAGVVLLTVGTDQSAATATWLSAHSGLARYAVGGPSAVADPAATAISGADRYATAVAVAAKFFQSATEVSLANGTAWPDAAVAAANSALNDSPLLLVTADALTDVVSTWLDGSSLTSVTAYGGTARISDSVLGSVTAITGLSLT